MEIISNVPASLEWHVYKGDTATISIIVTNDSNEEVDLSGMTFLGQIRETPKSATVLDTLSIVVTNNILSVTIPDTTELPLMSYFDIQATKEDETISTIIKGYIYSEEDVSR